MPFIGGREALDLYYHRLTEAYGNSEKRGISEIMMHIDKDVITLLGPGYTLGPHGEFYVREPYFSVPLDLSRGIKIDKKPRDKAPLDKDAYRWTFGSSFTIFFFYDKKR